MAMARSNQILAAYNAALAGRDPADVEIGELLPSIFATVPGVPVREIKAALIAEGERLEREASELEAWGAKRHGANDNG
jgi:hypothetical protein